MGKVLRALGRPHRLDTGHESRWGASRRRAVDGWPVNFFAAVALIFLIPRFKHMRFGVVDVYPNYLQHPDFVCGKKWQTCCPSCVAHNVSGLVD